jgi:hypothetical protein
MATENDKVILNLKKEIEAKKKLLASEVKFNPITNCSLELDGSRYNLHVANKETLLVLIAKLQGMKNALAGVMPNETLTFGGYVVEDWLKDLTAKFQVQNVSREKERLQKLEAKLHELLSVDTKVELEIKDIMSQI